MGTRITNDKNVALYDSTSGVAFGPVFSDRDEAEAFLEHLVGIGERDPRMIPIGELIELAAEWDGNRT